MRMENWISNPTDGVASILGERPFVSIAYLRMGVPVGLISASIWSSFATTPIALILHIDDVVKTDTNGGQGRDCANETE